ncbi:hypothetical protein [Streptomyces kanamyceticus]|uniref:Uncharacterized protein n=1 Tax=Streptomyces kanamyceticus TaxID=1967 RepID=A0A5J6GIU8_STRKN|nr:hypothetical protein [Streptomyces kanamyceticus]QEU94414.1 hypothetical protein CP970_29070 [Streptomyces kanamyceticus]
MEHTPTATWVTEAAKAARDQGPGNLLRVVLLVSIVGCVLIAWLLLRGYRQGADDEREGAGRESADKPSESVNQGRGDADEDRNG